MEIAGPSRTKPELVFVDGQRKRGKDPLHGTVLLHAGHRYNFAKRNKSNCTNWRCSNKRECSTSITLNTDNDIIKEGKHSCAPNFERNRNEKLLNECKKEVCSNMEPIQRIFEKHFLEKNDSDSLNLSDHSLPSFNTKKDTLYRCRNKFLCVEKCKSDKLEDVKIPECLVKDFFLYDDGQTDKIIVFGSQAARDLIKNTDIYYGDGTFKIAPKPFYQLFSLHVDITKGGDCVNFVPVLFILLPNKCQETYTIMFRILKEQLSVNITQFKCDYELAIAQALQCVYPDVTVKGCFYHFQNAVWKKSKELKFTSTANGRKLTQLCTQLALLPITLIPEGFLAINEMGTDDEECKAFFNYFTNYWMMKITNEQLSCYGERFRTTNAIEGWHRRINAKIPKKPSLFLFLQLLKKESKISDNKINRSYFHCEETKRRPKQILIDTQIQNIISDCINEKIPVITCLERLRSLKLSS